MNSSYANYSKIQPVLKHGSSIAAISVKKKHKSISYVLNSLPKKVSFHFYSRFRKVRDHLQPSKRNQQSPQQDRKEGRQLIHILDYYHVN